MSLPPYRAYEVICPKCYNTLFHNGTKWRWANTHLWVREWVCIELGASPVHLAKKHEWINNCHGCYNVAIERCLVLGILLSKLDVRPPRGSKYYGG